ncbi:hypothetical protein BBK36DRAFT_1136901 [Trichoderma citrinoviride]|uniref:Uncharacterized protein n=1 Tax=Trichoderma citrinoviride TaxID=58853 RepID=A0A2T4BLM8_9HYPO|nr:hypothetical protein BBK36DRAFT_1136901 [Trichoderma citrinoviride]PTB70224.1 hypothetical protein BBK36DRAFT_1136901 [Trichoderma citrinoviride]
MGNGHSSSKKDPRKDSRKDSRREPRRDSKKDSRKSSSRRDHKKDSKGTSSRHESSSHRSHRHRHSHSHARSHSHSRSHHTHGASHHNNNHRNTIHMGNEHDGSQQRAHQRMDFILQLFQDHSLVPQIHPLWESMTEDARSATLRLRDRGSAVTATERDDLVRMLYVGAPDAPETMGYGYDVEEDRLYSRDASPVVNALGIMNNEPPSEQGSARRHSTIGHSSVPSTDVGSSQRSRGRSLSPLIPQAAAFPPPGPALERAPPLQQAASTDHHHDRGHRSHSRSHAGPSSEGDRHHRHHSHSHSHSRSHARESSRERARRRPHPHKKSSSSRRK